MYVASVGAQNLERVADDEEREEVEEIIVRGLRQSLARGIDMKRSGDGIVEGISSSDISDFPDSNISEAIGRITGVTITKTVGQGDRIQIRGMNSEFIRVTINGQGIPSANPERDIDFDIFASELFSRVLVVKTPTAKSPEGGIGGTVDMRALRPFDFTEPSFASISAQYGTGDKADGTPYRLSAIFSKQMDNQNSGFVVSLALSNDSLREDRGFLDFRQGNVDVLADGSTTADLTDQTVPSELGYEFEGFEKSGIGLTASFQHRPSEHIDVNFDFVYAEQTIDQTRGRLGGVFLATGDDGNLTTDPYFTTDSSNNLSGLLLDPPGHAPLLNGNFLYKAALKGAPLQSLTELGESENTIILVNADSTFLFRDWNGKARFGYAQANNDNPSSSSIWTSDGQLGYVIDGDVPKISLLDGRNVQSPTHYNQHQWMASRLDIEESGISFELDLEKQASGKWLISSYEVGLRHDVREKKYKQLTGAYRDISGGENQGLSATDALAGGFPADGFLDGEQVSFNKWFFANLGAVKQNTNLVPSSFKLKEDLRGTYSLEEDTTGAYFIVNFERGRGRGHFGARRVQTKQSGQGYRIKIDDNGDIVTKEDGTPDAELVGGSFTYGGWLPSGSFVFEFSDEFIFRSVMSSSVTRQRPAEIKPGFDINLETRTATIIDPEEVFLSLQADMSFEWYFHPESLLSFGLFHKDLSGYGVLGTIGEPLPEAKGLPSVDENGEPITLTGDEIFTVLTSLDLETSEIQGYELSFQAPFFFLQEPFDRLGVVFNYTSLDADLPIPTNPTNLSASETVILTLPRQSESSYNLIAYYDQDPFSVRVAYTWRDQFIDRVDFSDPKNSVYVDAYGQFDINLQYRISDTMTLTLDGFNLTDENIRKFKQGRTTEYSKTGSRIFLGLRTQL